MSVNDPYFAQAFQGMMGRAPTQADFQELQNRQEIIRDGGRAKPSKWDNIAPYAPAVGSVAGYAGYNALLGGGGAAGGGGGIGSLVSSLGSSAAPTAATATSAGGTGVSLAGSVGSGAGAGGGMGVGSALSAAAPYAVGAAGAYGLYDTVANAPKYKQTGLKGIGSRAAQGAASGAAVGSVIPGVGTAAGAVIGGLLGAASARWGSGKDKYQVGRDTMRDFWESRGLIDNKHLFNGYEVGKDGGHRLGDGRKVYEIYAGQDKGIQGEWDEATSEAVGALNPLGAISAYGDDHLTGMGTGMLYNMLKETGEEGVISDEIRGMYDSMGLDHGTAFEAINYMHQNGDISEDEARAYQNALNQIYGSEYTSPEDAAGARAAAAQKVWG